MLKITRREFLKISSLSAIIFALPEKVKANNLEQHIDTSNLSKSDTGARFPISFPMSFSEATVEKPNTSQELKRILIPVISKDKPDITRLDK